MKKILLILSLFTLIISACKNSTNIDTNSNFVNIDTMSLYSLEQILIKRKTDIWQKSELKFDEPIPMSLAKHYVENYVNSIDLKYNIQNKNIIERSVLLKFNELETNIDLLREHYPQFDNYGYRIYFGRHDTVNTKYPTQHTIIVRITQNGDNIPDNLNIPHSTNKIRTIFNVGNICPPNCPPSNSAGGTWVDDMYTGEE